MVLFSGLYNASTEIVCDIIDSSTDELDNAKTIMIAITDKHVLITNFLIIVI
jgi:4-hydroxybenzoate polyprenyltransferase